MLTLICTNTLECARTRVDRRHDLNQRAPCAQTGQTGPPKVFAVLIVLTIVVRSSAFVCVGAILCQQEIVANFTLLTRGLAMELLWLLSEGMGLLLDFFED